MLQAIPLIFYPVTDYEKKKVHEHFWLERFVE